MATSPNSVPILTQIFAPIRDVILDPEVSEIMINGDGQVFVERAGRLFAIDRVTLPAEMRKEAAVQVARRAGRNIDELAPLTHVRLEDGSRVAMAFAPVSVGGTAISIRKFQQRFFAIDELVTIGTLSNIDAERLRACISARLNILIIGGTGTGKTSLLNACANEIDPAHRLAIIEDTVEIQVHLPNVLRIECRKESKSGDQTIPAVTAFAAVTEAALRFRPDRIIIGEVRGPEAFALLRAWTSGHAGSLSTIHADTVEQGLHWLAALAMTGAPPNMGYTIMRQFVKHAVHVVVLLKKEREQRRVVDIRRVQKRAGVADPSRTN